jgi:aspartyl-tRNA(Asn)/glutamyl-tRNA(Gln) amidotransferase subunit A
MIETTGIGTLGISDLSGAYRKKQLSPVEVVRALFENIRQKQPDYNLFIRLTEDAAFHATAEAEKRIRRGNPRSLLDGIPFGVKDIIYTKAIPTTMGSQIYKNFLPGYNAGVVERLYDAGAVLMGKLNTQQFALGPTGDRSSAGAARNPHNREKICGGSSSGSAAAVAAGLLPLSIGTDTGGSIRIPAHFCGVIGMKPTFGRVSLHGILPVSEELDHAGPLTRTVRDNAMALNIIAGHDPNDHFSVNIPACADYTRAIGKPVKGAVIGVPFSFFSDCIQPGVLSAVNNAIRVLEKQGAIMKNLGASSEVSSFARNWDCMACSIPR